MDASIFDAAKKGGVGVLYWALPILSGLTVFAGVTKRSQKIVAQLTGAIPFFILAEGFYKYGAEFLKVMGFGPWIGVILGLILFILVCRREGSLGQDQEGRQEDDHERRS